MASASLQTALNGNEHLILTVGQGFDVHITIDALVLWLLFIVIAFLAARPLLNMFGRWRRFEVDEAQFGLGEQKIVLRPNETDRQIAYKIWVELSTRKIGLPIDVHDDVIDEIYDSWYTFFSVTRELIKDVPVSKFRQRDTERIIRLSIEVLNTGVRPHLTRWQARFRRWYRRAIDHTDHVDLAPQQIQQSFPSFRELTEDLLIVNERLIRYREKMYELVTGR